MHMFTLVFESELEFEFEFEFEGGLWKKREGKVKQIPGI